MYSTKKMALGWTTLLKKRQQLLYMLFLRVGNSDVSLHFFDAGVGEGARGAAVLDPLRVLLALGDVLATFGPLVQDSAVLAAQSVHRELDQRDVPLAREFLLLGLGHRVGTHRQEPLHPLDRQSVLPRHFLPLLRAFLRHRLFHGLQFDVSPESDVFALGLLHFRRLLFRKQNVRTQLFLDVGDDLVVLQVFDGQNLDQGLGRGLRYFGTT
jgi:hypothetical protein